MHIKLRDRERQAWGWGAGDRGVGSRKRTGGGGMGLFAGNTVSPNETGIVLHHSLHVCCDSNSFILNAFCFILGEAGFVFLFFLLLMDNANHIIPSYCHLPVCCRSLVHRYGSLRSCKPHIYFFNFKGVTQVKGI